MKNKFNNKLYKKKSSIRHQKVYKFIAKNAWNLKINKINYQKIKLVNCNKEMRIILKKNYKNILQIQEL